MQSQWGREDDWGRSKEEQRGQRGWNRVGKRQSKRTLVRSCRKVGRSCLPKVIARALAFTLKELGRHWRFGAEERLGFDYI